MSTTIQTSKKTAQQLKELMKKTGANSYDEVIRKLLGDRNEIPVSLFGSNPKLKPFTEDDEAEFHEL
jgi:predicted CopG family antitoxin